MPSQYFQVFFEKNNPSCIQCSYITEAQGEVWGVGECSIQRDRGWDRRAGYAGGVGKGDIGGGLAWDVTLLRKNCKKLKYNLQIF